MTWVIKLCEIAEGKRRERTVFALGDIDAPIDIADLGMSLATGKALLSAVQAYAFEELVAEIGAAAMGLKIGLPPQMLDDHASYLAHWVKILKSRPSALLEASGHAQRAVDHLLAYSQPGRQIESEIEEAA